MVQCLCLALFTAGFSLGSMNVLDQRLLSLCRWMVTFSYTNDFRSWSKNKRYCAVLTFMFQYCVKMTDHKGNCKSSLWPLTDFYKGFSAARFELICEHKWLGLFCVEAGTGYTFPLFSFQDAELIDCVKTENLSRVSHKLTFIGDFS